MKARIHYALALTFSLASLSAFAAREGRPKTEKGTDAFIKVEPTAGAQSNVSCPQSVVVGVINPPAGWTDYNARRIHFTGSVIRNTAQGAEITCDYGAGAALNRLVPGRVCERLSTDGPHMSCRAIPTKK
jgi:hypothetical protein